MVMSSEQDAPSSSTTTPDRPYLSAIDRTRRDGHVRYELTSFFARPGALQAFVKDTIDFFQAEMESLDAWVGLDALGFLVSGGLSAVTGKPVIPARKGGKLALPESDILRTGHISDYLKLDEKVMAKTLEVRKDLIKPGMKVIVVDEWIDTGGQISSLIEVLEGAGAKVVGVATLHITSSRTEKTRRLRTERKVFAAEHFSKD